MSKPNVTPDALRIAGKLVAGNLLSEFARPVAIDTPATEDEVRGFWEYEIETGLTDLPFDKFYSMWLEQERISRDAKNYATFTQRQRQVAEAISVEFPVRIKNNKQAFEQLEYMGIRGIEYVGKTLLARAEFSFLSGPRIQLKVKWGWMTGGIPIEFLTQLKPVHRMSKVFDIIKKMK